MKSLSKKNKEKLNARLSNNALRTLKEQSELVDFSSNDYLGFAKSETIFDNTHQFLIDQNIKVNGATGSRLLSGNHSLYQDVENMLSECHQSESAIIFNSGYDANLGFFSTIPQRGDIILYDEFIHASIRDGIQLSNAKAYKFKHNDVTNLEKRVLSVRAQSRTKESEIYIVTEAVFSMDGDSPDLKKIAELSTKNNAFLIVDEAHSVGVFNEGLVQKMNIENDVFARIITFGKAFGCHGAAILGSEDLKTYLVNFARSFIYTTGLSPHSLATIKMSYNELKSSKSHQQKLQENIHHFIAEIKRLQLSFIPSCSAIHCCVISGNEKVKSISENLQKSGFDVKSILSPTVPKNRERLRFCLHSYNSKKEITKVLELFNTFAKT
ncbi:pyridoxal phosphate-dependent aminotransferase family protein [Lutibacter sp. Hel_I_33_5]|uniref:aminotransferase class I/II-fold pyridoxal phosphate-dependent enzyme n=1 Tax=Lutibacter sp. Hel_I_33_5 TaxID=1566289 RepID=UPI00119CBD5D|nr:pyridoxal phosphate-dependent aminotransferase family protein [Lutibacter sp. Hel_I_33_5]